MPLLGTYLTEFQEPDPTETAAAHSKSGNGGRSIFLHRGGDPNGGGRSRKEPLLGTISQSNGPTINVALLSQDEMASQRRNIVAQANSNVSQSSSAVEEIEKNAASWLMKSNSWMPVRGCC